jgi:DNA polymerase
LERELQILKPKLIVLMGATAAGSVLQRTVSIQRTRGEIFAGPGLDASVLVTVHPSFLLRIPKEQYDDAYLRFVAELRLAKPFIGDRNPSIQSAEISN